MSLDGIDLVVEGRARKVTDMPTLERVRECLRLPGLAGERRRRSDHGKRGTGTVGSLRGHCNHSRRSRDQGAARSDSLAV